ncbi:MAG: hypothetical protein JO270_00045 [Acidobacteriaceae bacterium]|nr:hypothetical protein [Acidobacteriaceae bacterium]MBV8569229.1 hypothetical protein [Acidobacteriaceae bacterium]
MEEKRPSFQPLAITLTVVAAVLRLIPHPPNFAPVGSVALFGGARLRGWQAFVVPVLAMLITDPILSRMAGFPAYSWTSLVIYSCFMINVALGRAFLRRSSNPGRIAAVALAGSLQFYLITNFFVWLGDASLYARTASGLIDCYIAALPFLGRTVLGDLFYSAALFGAYALLSRHAVRGNGRTAAA